MIWDKQDDDRWEGFACACSEEGKQEIAEMRAEVAKALGNPADSDFLSVVVYRLEHDYSGASIDGMFCDLWAMVTAEKKNWASEEDPKPVTFSVRAQCDKVEDGVAMVMQAFTKRFPEE
jgi:hypothetical protein